MLRTMSWIYPPNRPKILISVLAVGNICGSTNRTIYFSLETVSNAQNFDAVAAFLSSLAKGTQIVYKRARRHWIMFCNGYNRQPWLNPGVAGWGEIPIKFIMREYGVLGLHPSSIRAKIAGIRLYHTMAGSIDFSVHGLRYKQLLKSSQKTKPAQRKLPISPEMLFWFYDRVSFDWCDRRFEIIWDALILGFTFLLRGSEIKNLRHRDLNLCVGNGNSFLTMCIRKVKLTRRAKVFSGAFSRMRVFFVLSRVGMFFVRNTSARTNCIRFCFSYDHIRRFEHNNKVGG